METKKSGFAKSATIVWGGIGWLATAILLARQWYKVSVYEKNECLGGRASILYKDWYTFDMWPSRYLMPDVFKEFFQSIDEDIHSWLDLKQLSPSYRVFYEKATKAEITKKTKKGNVIFLHWFHDNANDGRRKRVWDMLTKEWYTCFHPQCNHEEWMSLEKDIQAILEQVGKENINKETIIIGYSLGGVTARHLINACGIKIAKLITVASSFPRPASGDDLWEEELLRYRETPLDFGRFNTLVTQNIALFSTNDPIIPYDQALKYRSKNFPRASIVSLDSKFHFNWWNDIVDLPELLQYIDDDFHFDMLERLDVYADKELMAKQFDAIEPWAWKQLIKFLDRSKEQYEIGMEFCKKNYDSIFDFFHWDMMRKGLNLNIWTTIDKYVARFFKTTIVQQTMQYTTVFLGTAPKQTPALYNIMSHVDFNMGVWYPKGGMHQIAKALHKIGLRYGIEYNLNTEVIWCEIDKSTNTISSLIIQWGEKGNDKSNWELRTHNPKKVGTGWELKSDIFVINADMARFEAAILPCDYQTYPKTYRDKKIFAPSGFIIYAGINKQLPNLDHHNLYFCEDRDKNFGQIFDTKELPSDPSIYVSKITHSDPDMAPEWCENLFILVPIPNGIEIDDNQKKQYKDKIWKVVEKMAGEDITWYIQTEELFSIDEFKKRYYARQGTALGLAHPITQTAVFRPNNVSKKLHNLFYVWHNTNPGIGVPMVLISAWLVTQRILKRYPNS